MNTYIPKITINYEVGCCTCHKALNVPSNSGGCGCGTAPRVAEDTTSNSPCVGCNDACEDIFKTDCILVSHEDVPQLAITKGDKLTGVLVKLYSEILALKARVATLESA